MIEAIVRNALICIAKLIRVYPPSLAIVPRDPAADPSAETRHVYRNNAHRCQDVPITVSLPRPTAYVAGTITL